MREEVSRLEATRTELATDVESMARQPEVAGQIQTAMLIAAALIEGATFFALIICIASGAPWPAVQ